MQHILVIEDSRTILNFELDEIKRKLGFPTVFAMNYQSARNMLDTYKGQLFVALADLVLPDAPNGEIVDLLLEHNIPTIVVTSEFSDATRTLMLKKPIVDYVVKDSMNAFDYALRLVERIYYNRSLKALVVDDSTVARHIMVSLLKRLQLTILEASSGEEALRIMEENPEIQLALIDEEMPNMKGSELIVKLRQKYDSSELPILGITGSDSFQAIEFLKRGANDFIRKPFAEEEFIVRVLNTLEMSYAIKKAREGAYIDFLTGLYNRKYLYEKIGTLYGKKGEYTLALLDIDYFKKINDTHGHDIGDTVLRHISSLLTTYCPSPHIVMRIGGEEFVIAFMAMENDAVRGMCELLRRMITQKALLINEERLPLSVSFGISLDKNLSFEETLKQCDKNLYKAKEGGRNRVVG